MKVVVDTKLPDNDEVYETLITDRLTKAMGTSAPPRAPRPTTPAPNSERQAKVVAKTPPAQPTQQPHQALQQRAMKRNKKAQVSVFRVSNGR
jgi:hypothetical protein